MRRRPGASWPARIRDFTRTRVLDCGEEIDPGTDDREQMIAEFGEPGVQKPKIIDLIEIDPVSDKVVLVMIEHRAWGAGPHQFQQIEEKINRYLGYVLDGHLAKHYPQHDGIVHLWPH